MVPETYELKMNSVHALYNSLEKKKKIQSQATLLHYLKDQQSIQGKKVN